MAYINFNNYKQEKKETVILNIKMLLCPLFCVKILPTLQLGNILKICINLGTLHFGVVSPVWEF